MRSFNFTPATEIDSAMTVSATIVEQYYNAIFRKPAPPWAISAYGWMENDDAALVSMLNGAKFESTATIIRLYQAAFNRLPDAKGLTDWTIPLASGELTLTQIIDGFVSSAEFQKLYPPDMANAQFIGALYWNVLQRVPDPAGFQFFVDYLQDGGSRVYVLQIFATSVELTNKTSASVNAFLTNIARTPIADQTNPALFQGNLYDLGGPSTTYTLTPNPDTFGDPALGTQQIFIAQPGTFTVFDTLKGGANTSDTFTINDATPGGYTNPASFTVYGIEIVNFNLAAAGTVNTTGGLDVTKLTVNSAPGVAANNLSVSAAAPTAVTVNTTPGATSTTINGGSSIKTKITGAASGNLIIGSTTASAGAVDVTYTSSAAASGNIAVTGGTSVAINTSIAAGTSINTGGSITVNATAITSVVRVTQSGATSAGVAPGAVTIAGGVAALKDIALSNYGNSTIAATSLSNLSLTSTGEVVAGTPLASGTLFATTASTNMNLLLGGGSLGALTFVGNTVATLNAVMSADTTIAAIHDTGLRTITLGGKGVMTINVFNTAVTSLTLNLPFFASTVAAGLNADVSGASGLTVINFASSSANNNIDINAANQTYTGGSGNDTITIAVNPTKNITGGSGFDKIVLGAAASNFTSNVGTYVSGFEAVGFNAASSGTYNLTTLGLTGISAITLTASVGPATVAYNVTAGTVLNINAAQANGFTYMLAGTSGPSSSVTVNTNLTNGGGGIIAGLILEDSLMNGIGTVNIVANDTQANQLHAIDLTDNKLSTLNLSGNAGVTLVSALTTSSSTLSISNTSTSTNSATGDITSIVAASLTSLSFSGTHDTEIATLTNGMAVTSIANANTNTTPETGVLTILNHTNANLNWLSLNGAVALNGTYALNGAALVEGATDHASVSLTMNGGGVKTITLGNGSNTIVTGVAADVITVGTGSNNITAAAGADTITVASGSTALTKSTIVQGTASSVAVSTTMSGAFAAGNVLAFANGVDVVTGFTAGTDGDVLDVAVNAAAVTGIGVANNTLVAGTNYFLSGTWNSTAKTFTVAADGTGADTIIVQGFAAAGTDIDTNTSSIVLIGVDSDNLVAGNFA